MLIERKQVDKKTEYNIWFHKKYKYKLLEKLQYLKNGYWIFNNYYATEK